MNNEYDSITALHYASYRPSLHTQLLKSYLHSDEKFEIGLDVGCGTGQSAISLSSFCSKVVGVDPSQEMINKSIIKTKVSYHLMQPNKLDFSNDTFEVVTFAGSLFYAKSQALLNETIRVSKSNSKIIVYDFEVLMSDAFKLLEIDDNDLSNSDYDHTTNFSGLDEHCLAQIEQFKQMVQFEISISDLAHLLLSSKEDYTRVATKFKSDDLYGAVLQHLKKRIKLSTMHLKANTYLTAYTVTKK
jgi:ubiquinone/menaquinone biosynthesis C-methylase UbiE